MKIKFIKEYRALNINTEDSGLDVTIKAGEINDLLNSETAQWLIDNGFAEEVKESGWWKPKEGELYYFVDDSGYISYTHWKNDPWEVDRLDIRNCFKTEEAAERWRDYLKAVATVRQDEGVLTPEEAVRKITTHYVSVDTESQLGVWWLNSTVNCMSANAILFDTAGNARASLNKHPDEWKIIASYDWGRE